MGTRLLLCITRHSLLSKLTLHPALQNFLMEINDVWDRPGTICASVILSGNHGIFRLQACIDLICLPLGSRMQIGVVASCLLTIGAPATMKWPVAPESAMAYCTACVSCLLLNIVCACGVSRRLYQLIIVFHAVCCMDNGIGVIIGKVAFLGWPVLYGRLVAFGLMCAGIDKFDKFDVGTVTPSSYEL